MPGNPWVWSKTASDNDDADGTINWTEGQNPSTVNNSARAMMAAIANFRDDQGGALSTTGVGNVYVATTNAGLTALADGIMLSVKINIANTSAATLNVDATGAKALRKFTQATETAVVQGDLIAGAHYILQYNSGANGGSGAWIVLNPSYSPVPASSVDNQIAIFDGTSGQLAGAGAFIDDTGRLLTDDGTQALPGHSFITDSDTGAFNPAVGVYAITTDGTERLRIASGNMLVGTTTAVFGSGRVQSQDTTAPFNASCTNASNLGAGIYIDRTASDGFMAVFYRNGVTAGSISQSGSSVTYNTTSDARLKTNVLPMAGYGLSVVRRLKPCSFDWTTSRMRDYGLIAQEVHDVAPNAVTPGDVWQLDQSKLVAFLIDAVQVLDKRLQALESDGA